MTCRRMRRACSIRAQPPQENLIEKRLSSPRKTTRLRHCESEPNQLSILQNQPASPS